MTLIRVHSFNHPIMRENTSEKKNNPNKPQLFLSATLPQHFHLSARGCYIKSNIEYYKLVQRAKIVNLKPSMSSRLEHNISRKGYMIRCLLWILSLCAVCVLKNQVLVFLRNFSATIAPFWFSRTVVEVPYTSIFVYLNSWAKWNCDVYLSYRISAH